MVDSPFGDFDVVYRPHLLELSWLKLVRPASLLIVGDATEDAVTSIQQVHGGDLRELRVSGLDRNLHNGVYSFIIRGTWHALFVVNGLPSHEAREELSNFSSTDLGIARDLFLDLWSDGKEIGSLPTLRVGDLVRSPGSPTIGTVRDVDLTSDGVMVRVAFGDRVERLPESSLVPVDGDPEDPRVWISGGEAETASVLRTLTFAKLDKPLSNLVYSYGASRTTFWPYQFIPVMKIINGQKGKILVADEVGLGKTIEAGLIWTEIDLRHRVHRGLVISPAGVKSKWRREMSNRFGRELEDLSIGRLREFIQDIKADRNPDLHGVVSLNALVHGNAMDVLEALSEFQPRFDVVVVDEAHALRNKNTRSWEVGEVISRLADNMVFLSATPVNLHERDLFNLLSLLDPEGFPDFQSFPTQLEPNRNLLNINRLVSSGNRGNRSEALSLINGIPDLGAHGAAMGSRPDFARLRSLVADSDDYGPDVISRIRSLVASLSTLESVFTRTRKVDVPGTKAIREVEEIEVVWTQEERDLYDAIYATSMANARRKNVPLGFAMQMPLRQACSSLHVAQERILTREGWDLSDVEDVNAELDFEDSIEAAHFEAGDDPSTIRRPLLVDSKLDALLKRLRLAREQGIKRFLIFSFFVGTVEYLAEQLSAEFSTRYIHGKVPVKDRDAIISEFENGDCEILIANQVGSEGLDFQFCNVVVNYDLPWNPMQVEQRIGRIDRTGQEAQRVFIFNMKTPGTIETDIFGRLYQRIEVFENSIGDLEPIMRQTFSTLNRELLNPDLTQEEKEEAIRQFAIRTANERSTLSEISANEGAMHLLSEVDIEGISDQGPTNGRYVSADETLGIIEWFVEKYGGRVSPTSQSGVFEITGNLDLSSHVNRLPANEVRSRADQQNIQKLLSSEEPFLATGDPHLAKRASIELISISHPLMLAALQKLRDSREAMSRFTHLKLSDSPQAGTFLVSFDYLHVRGGLNDRLDLWATAIPLHETGSSGISRAEPIENAVFAAIATGKLSAPLTHHGLSKYSVLESFESLQSLIDRRVAEERIERMAENKSFVQARIASTRNSIDVRRKRSEERLREMLSKNADPRIIRLHEGAIRNSDHDAEMLENRFADKSEITVSQSSVAVLIIST